MRLKILLPHQIYQEIAGVKRIVIETIDGAYGLLPHRLDCVAVLEPGILSYEDDASNMHYIAIDEGFLVKTGREIRVSVRNAIGGTDLGSLREAVVSQFKNLDEEEKQLRASLVKLENGFVRRFAELTRV